MNRIEKLEVPEEALREILYNAIIHKDYTGVHIQMRVWNDHVEVWNEGELPLGYTPATLLKQHASHPRNRNIANAFFKAGFIDAWGRGYKKIREGFEDAGLPMPTVENFCGGVRVSFQRKNVNIAKPNPTDTQNVAVNVADSVAENVAGSTLKDTLKSTLKGTLKGTQKHIVELIEENPDITIDNVAELLQMNRRGIVKHFKNLKQKGIIRRVGPDKGGHWEIINNKE